MALTLKEKLAKLEAGTLTEAEILTLASEVETAKAQKAGNRKAKRAARSPEVKAIYADKRADRRATKKAYEALLLAKATQAKAKATAKAEA